MAEYQSEAEECFISFFLSDEEYAISIENAREIIDVQKISHLPDTPDFVKGVINLRNKVIPVIDLRLRFKFPFKEYDEETCIIITEITSKEIMMTMGIIVDSVSDVSYIPMEKIDESAVKHSIIKNDYIKGVVKNNDDGVKIILDLNRIINQEHLEIIADKTTGD